MTTTVAVLGGAIILFPSLVLLFRLTLGGQLAHAHEEHAAAPGPARDLVLAAAPGLLGRVAAACLVVGFGLLTVAEAGWAHAIGVVALFGFIVVGFAGAVPALLEGEPGSSGRSPHREGDAHRHEGILEAGAGLATPRRRSCARPRAGRPAARGSARRAGDDGAVTAVGRHDAVGLELAVGAGDRPAGQAEVVGELADRRAGGRRSPAPPPRTSAVTCWRSCS